MIILKAIGGLAFKGNRSFFIIASGSSFYIKHQRMVIEGLNVIGFVIHNGQFIVGCNAISRRFVISTIVNEFMGVIKTVDDLTFKKMDERLVSYLKGKSKVSGSSLVNLSHQQIADELGTNRVVVSRLLKKLENEKRVLLYRNQVKLLRDL